MKEKLHKFEALNVHEIIIRVRRVDEHGRPEKDKQEFDLKTSDEKEILRQEQNGIFRVNLTKLEFLCYDLNDLGKYDFPMIIFNFGKKTSLESHASA